MLKIATLFIGLIIVLVIVYIYVSTPTTSSFPGEQEHAPLCSEEPCPTPL